MTKQIGQAYRRNRRGSWLLIAALVVLAVVAIPIASGAAEKTYTLGFDLTQPVPTQAKSVCTGTPAPTVDVYLRNTAKSASLGSAKITVPLYFTVVSAHRNGDLPPLEGPNFTRPAPNIVLLQDLGLAKNEYVKLVVELPVIGSGSVSAIVKQSNNFNDAASTANLFSNPGPPWPTLTAAACGTISGTVWNDQNENGSKDSFENPQATGVFSGGSTGWSVKLYQKVEATTPTYTEFTDASLAYGGANGSYTFSKVPFGPDYVVCEFAPSGTWTQTEPEPAAVSFATASPPCGSDLPKGWTFASFAANETGSFGNVNTVEIDCAVSSTKQQIITTAQSRYTIQIAGPECKTRPFILEAYAPDADQRVANFHPVTGGGAKIELIEKLEWIFSGTNQPDPAGRSLKYDDDATNGINPLPMPYCLRDPRTSDWVLGSTSNVLPTVGDVGATSCLIASTERAVADPSATPKQFNRVDWIYSSVDGYRLSP